jgi:hypothetical protein
VEGAGERTDALAHGPAARPERVERGAHPLGVLAQARLVQRDVRVGEHRERERAGGVALRERGAACQLGKPQERAAHAAGRGRHGRRVEVRERGEELEERLVHDARLEHAHVAEPGVDGEDARAALDARELRDERLDERVVARLARLLPRLQDQRRARDRGEHLGREGQVLRGGVSTGGGT